MVNRICKWDKSHSFEADENDTYRILCPVCYHNIFIDMYKKVMSWDEFENDIEPIKKTHRYLAALDTYYKNNIMKFAESNHEEVAVKVTCLICNKEYAVKQNETWRYLCSTCRDKCYHQLKQGRSYKEIKNIILSLKEVTKDADLLIEKLKQIANED